VIDGDRIVSVGNAEELKIPKNAQVVDCAGELAKVWVIAPESNGLEPVMEYVKKVNPNVVFAFGHCEADTNRIKKLKKYGIKLQIHSMNATGRISDIFNVKK